MRVSYGHFNTALIPFASDLPLAGSMLVILHYHEKAVWKLDILKTSQVTGFADYV